jgi:hypothetical protein
MLDMRRQFHAMDIHMDGIPVNYLGDSLPRSRIRAECCFTRIVNKGSYTSMMDVSGTGADERRDE